MAEQILPPNMAALLAPPDPQQQRLISLAALARAGALNGPPPAMPPTLSGVENAQPPMPPVPHRALGRILAQTAGGIAGGAGGGLIGGVPGAIVGAVPGVQVLVSYTTRLPTSCLGRKSVRRS
jgi:hypothetical protein